ncbi:hypothetical protein PG993_001363 [Apiospora rasikravindrae]|uniref:Uncharacterized protein n=1 Tax=Apiospora rasikravindrae TaxID=990691 RepID=A0ABR1UD95_9PEZI
MVPDKLGVPVSPQLEIRTGGTMNIMEAMVHYPPISTAPAFEALVECDRLANKAQTPEGEWTTYQAFALATLRRLANGWHLPALKRVIGNRDTAVDFVSVGR